MTHMPSLKIDEQREARPRGSLVAVRKWMVPGNPTGKDCGLVEHVGVEIRVTEAGLRRMERRVSEIDSACFDQRPSIDAGDLLSQEPELQRG